MSSLLEWKPLSQVYRWHFYNQSKCEKEWVGVCMYTLTCTYVGIWHMFICHCIAEGHSVNQNATRTEGKGEAIDNSCDRTGLFRWWLDGLTNTGCTGYHRQQQLCFPYSPDVFLLFIFYLSVLLFCHLLSSSLSLYKNKDAPPTSHTHSHKQTQTQN